MTNLDLTGASDAKAQAAARAARRAAAMTALASLTAMVAARALVGWLGLGAVEEALAGELLAAVIPEALALLTGGAVAAWSALRAASYGYACVWSAPANVIMADPYAAARRGIGR